MTHFPALDGFRGLAILAVVGYHLGYFPGGSAGVTMFFTLSGFLITCLLLDEFDETGSVSFRNFYMRRGLRLLPAVFVLIAADVGFVMLWRTGWTRKADLAAAVSTLMYSSNWVAAYGVLPLNQLGHTWSLSVEEQFYLLWPVTIVCLVRLGFRHTNASLLLLLLGACLTVERFVLARFGAQEVRLFYGLDTRADALLFGAAVATTFRGAVARQSWFNRLVDCVGIGALLILMAHAFLGWGSVQRSTAPMSIGSYTAVGLLSAAVILFLTSGSAAAQWASEPLSLAPLRFVGRISYGLYLWHPVAFAFVDQTRLGAVGSMTAKAALTFSVTLGSYYLVERPCLRLKERFARGRGVSVADFYATTTSPPVAAAER